MRVIRALKTVNYRLWLAILATMLLPTVYQTVRIYFLGDLSSDWVVNIASQFSWANLFYEVVQEALILPLFFLLGKAQHNREELANKVRTGLSVTSVIYTIVSRIIVACVRHLVVFMAQSGELIDATVTYIRLETIAALFSTL